LNAATTFGSRWWLLRRADTILLKPGALTPEEFETVKTHAAVGAQILSGSQSTVLQLAEEIALTHHERWDGSGYPAGLSADQIPLAGRIVALADVFDRLCRAARRDRRSAALTVFLGALRNYWESVAYDLNR
jgi:response regulator RpfG family c-di-GMP phosphodiesterase